MSTKQRHHGGRPSKGERRPVISRMPVALVEKLEAVVEARGTSMSDYVADLVAQDLKTIDVATLNPAQEELPIIRAS